MNAQTTVLFAVTFLAAGFVAGCGGSSGGGDQAPGVVLPRDTQTIAGDIVSGCATESIGEWRTILSAVQGVGADGTPQTPAARLDGFVLLPSPGVNWIFDIDGDGQDDGTGQTTFPGAGPAFFLLFAQLAAGTISNTEFLSEIPDGTQVRTAFDVDRTFYTTGVVTTTLNNPGDGSPAFPASSDGDVTIARPDCEVRYQWLDIAFDDIVVPAGAYPTAELAMDVRSAEGDLDGVLSMNGTSEALLATQLLPSGESNNFAIDLTTGAVIPLDE